MCRADDTHNTFRNLTSIIEQLLGCINFKTLFTTASE